MTLWLTARAAGLAALILLSASMTIGVLVSGRTGRQAGTRVVVQYLHRITASLGIGILLLHIATIVADSYADVGVTGAIVPFTSGYRATWVGLGTLAAYCFLLISALGFARGRLAGSARGAKVWRGLHCSAYAGWAIAVVHGFFSGTDSGLAWVRVLYLACIASVAIAASSRIAALVQPRTLVRTAVLQSGRAS